MKLSEKLRMWSNRLYQQAYDSAHWLPMATILGFYLRKFAEEAEALEARVASTAFCGQMAYGVQTGTNIQVCFMERIEWIEPKPETTS